MRKDIYGNIVTTDSDDLLAGINDFINGFLSYTPEMTNILPAVSDDNDSCLANAYAAFLWMFMEAPEGKEKAHIFALAAQNLKPGATRREGLIADMALSWVNGELKDVLETAHTILTDFPKDLATLKLAQYHAFNLGDSLSMLRFANMCETANSDIAHMHSMSAFAYEQCHLLDKAEKSAQKALQINPDDPWAHHALAHVFLTQGRIDEGIVFLRDVSSSWNGLNSFMYTHNWWHLGVFHINRGEMVRALEIYDQHIWSQEKSYSQDQVGAVSFLARLEMAGVDVGNRWQEPAEYIAQRGLDLTLPFLSVQYLLGLAKAGRDEAILLFNGITKKSKSDELWRNSALPLSIGIFALVKKRYDKAAKYLGRALIHIQEIGGSHAQRDLFEQLYLDALLKAGQMNTAQQLLEIRRSFDADNVPLNLELARVYRHTGLDKLAHEAANRAQKRLLQNKVSHG
ncbi:MAG TPA: tetratricopeptide repeat protein [Hellea balneolensis]|uniref:Tetratricopeptide repeat protein 38 n=1 Tax=Hellea balneolensis TaxID=287478 RepID=A0A7C5QQR5_9PROT|nr:tetratricopeptide repeat protein [Hellea balneolensis]